MIPKGNMMASTLNKLEGDNYDLIEFRCSNKKETPEENKQLEEEIKQFLEKGISKISRQGRQCTIYLQVWKNRQFWGNFGAILMLFAVQRTPW